MVEHCSAKAEATGSNPFEAPKNFFSGYFAIDHLHYDVIRAKPDGSCSRPAETGLSVSKNGGKQAGKPRVRNAIER